MDEGEILEFFDRHYSDWLPWNYLFRHISLVPAADYTVQAGKSFQSPGEICFSHQTEPLNEASAEWLSVVTSTQDGDVYLEAGGEKKPASLPYVRLLLQALQKAHDGLSRQEARAALSAFRERLVASFSQVVTELRNPDGLVDLTSGGSRFYRTILSLPCGDILMPITEYENRKPGPFMMRKAQAHGLLIQPISILNDWAVVNWPGGKLAIAYGDDCAEMLSRMIAAFCENYGVSGHERMTVAEMTRPLIDGLSGATDFTSLYKSVPCPLAPRA